MTGHSRRLLEQKLGELEKQHHIRLSSDQCQLLTGLDELVGKWNRAISLVGFRTEEDRIDRYFIEALHSSQWLPAEGSAIDIGSGGGTPALPLAIENRQIQWKMLESNRRKAIFLEEAVASLKLPNATVERSRFEDYLPHTKVSVVTTRGVAIDAKFIQTVESWIQPDGKILFFTGTTKAVRIEQKALAGWRVCENIRLAPRYDAELLVVERC